MTDSERPDQTPGDERPEDEAHLSGDVPIEQREPDVEDAPRRAASAEFAVSGQIGSQAALREAMDPANQSLAEALRLSFRVLQLVIVILVILFFTSGFQAVGEGESGVLTRFGRIVTVDGQEALSPGLQFSRWPYPAGEFVIFEADNREVQLRNDFFPFMPPGMTVQQATDRADVRAGLHPIRREAGGQRGDGYVITRDGDFAHIRVTCRYQISEPGQFVRRLPVRDADSVVRLALRQATIQAAAEKSLTEIVDNSEVMADEIRQRTQMLLDDMNLGIRLSSLSVPEAYPPFAIRRTFAQVQDARGEAEQQIQDAQRRANQRLIDVAGERHRDLQRLIRRYERAANLRQEERAEELLAEIDQLLDSGVLSGEVARTIQMARAYRSQIEASLGNEARRFQSLLPAFREHPEFVIRERWMQTYSNVLTNRDTEVWLMPSNLGTLRMGLAGLHEIKELRQRMRLDRREREAVDDFMQRLRPQHIDVGERYREGPGRQFDIQDGRMRGRGQQ